MEEAGLLGATLPAAGPRDGPGSLGERGREREGERWRARETERESGTDRHEII